MICYEGGRQDRRTNRPDTKKEIGQGGMDHEQSLTKTWGLISRSMSFATLTCIYWGSDLLGATGTGTEKDGKGMV